MKATEQRRRVAAHEAFPLRTVAAMTGLTPDLIRAWEKRHAVVAPIRGARGARLYSSADIAHLRLLSRVVRAGRAIGDVAALSPVELERLAAQHPPGSQVPESARTPSPAADSITRILERLEHFDDEAATRLLGDAVVGLGVRGFVHEIALPLVHRVGAHWAEGTLSIAEEHLSTGILRNLLAGLMLGRSALGRPIVLATLAGERHEIGLLLFALLARDAGINVLYLGVDLPAADILTAAARSEACVVGLSLVASENRSRAIDELAAIQGGLPRECELWLGGADAAKVAAAAKSNRGLVFDSLQAAEAELTRIAAAPFAPGSKGPGERGPSRRRT